MFHSSGLVLFHSGFNKEMKESSSVRGNVSVCVHVFVYVPVCSDLANSSQNRLKKVLFFSFVTRGTLHLLAAI